MKLSSKIPTATLLLLVLAAGCQTNKPAQSPPAFADAPKSPAPPPAPAPVAAPAQPAEEHARILPPSASAAPLPFQGEGWEALLDGKTLKGWKEGPFAGHGEIEIESGAVILNMGNPFTGINYTNEFPTMNYEIAFDAMRISGSDFFCGLTVPVDESFCSLIVGGWGGSLVGISSLNGMDASENETSKFMAFDQKRWYRIRLRMTEGRIEGWIDEQKIIDVNTSEKKIALRPGEIELSKPFGLACWQTTAAIRELKMRRVDKPADKPKKY